MATAIVTGIRGSDKWAVGSVFLIITCCFYGDEVGDDVEGKPFEELLQLSTGYNLPTMKTNMIAAVQLRSTKLGLTVADIDIDIPSYEHGP